MGYDSLEATEINEKIILDETIARCTGAQKNKSYTRRQQTGHHPKAPYPGPTGLGNSVTPSTNERKKDKKAQLQTAATMDTGTRHRSARILQRSYFSPRKIATIIDRGEHIENAMTMYILVQKIFNTLAFANGSPGMDRITRHRLIAEKGELISAGEMVDVQDNLITATQLWERIKEQVYRSIWKTRLDDEEYTSGITSSLYNTEILLRTFDRKNRDDAYDRVVESLDTLVGIALEIVSILSNPDLTKYLHGGDSFSDEE
jgi:hypothetical protein